MPHENKLTAYIHPVSVQSIQLVFILGLNPVPSISIYLGSNVIDIVNLLGLLSLSLSLDQKGCEWNKQLDTLSLSLSLSLSLFLLIKKVVNGTNN